MDHLITQVLEVGRAMWRRRWIGIAVAWLVAILGAAGLATIRDRFEATARVYVDTKSVLRPLMRDLAVEPDLDQTVGLLARTLITRPNVEILVGKSFPSARAMPPEERERMIESMTREIKIASSGRDNVFNFSYRGTDPETHPSRRRQSGLAVSGLGHRQQAARCTSRPRLHRRTDQELRSATGRGRKPPQGIQAAQPGSHRCFRQGLLRADDAAHGGDEQVVGRAQGGRAIEGRAQARAEWRNRVARPGEPCAVDQQVSEYDARLEAQRKQLDELCAVIQNSIPTSSLPSA
jgi:hypothetical protein